MRGTIVVGAVIAVAIASATAAEARQSGATLTIDEAVTRATSSAPRLAEADARIAGARAVTAARTAQGKPMVTLTGTVLRTNHVDEFGVPQADGSFRVIFPDIPSNYRARAEVTLPVFTGGRIDALVASAEADRMAAEAERAAAAADVALETVNAYWTLVVARARVTVLERALERADASLADIRARVETGILPPNDLLSSQAQRARQNVQLIQARNEAAVANAQLARLVGADPDVTLTPASDVNQPLAQAGALLASTPAQLAARATEQRPERRALQARQTAFMATSSASLLARRPQVGVVAALEPARPNSRFVPRKDVWNTSWDLALNVTWSLWDGGRARAEAAASAAQAGAMNRRMEEFDAQLGVEVRQRVMDIASTRAALEASTEAVTAATEARRVVSERFNAGVSTSTDVLESGVALLDAELERVRLLASLRAQESRLIRTVDGR